jgi:hypothetical protein
MTNAQGVDISVWQDQNSTPQMFDPWKARGKGASFAGIKISQANWADPDYALNWAHCKGILYRMPYHFLTWDVSPFKQAEVFWSLIERDTFALLPLTCDFEWWKVTPANAMDKLYSFTYRLKQLADPLPQAIYTAKVFWQPNGSIADYWKQFHLWLCDIEGAVQVPKPWETWTFHQYTFKLPGPEWGAESLDLDGDYYNGTLEQMMARFHLPALSGMPEPPQPEPLPASGIVQVDNLFLRSWAGKGQNIIGQLDMGAAVDILERCPDPDGNGEWLRVKANGWVAGTWAGSEFVR